MQRSIGAGVSIRAVPRDANTPRKPARKDYASILHCEIEGRIPEKDRSVYGKRITFQKLMHGVVQKHNSDAQLLSLHYFLFQFDHKHVTNGDGNEQQAATVVQKKLVLL